MSGNHLGIVELADVCARHRARSLDIFEWLGDVAEVRPFALQRLVAEACHRHAWHAELWGARSPSIPGVDLDAATERHRTPFAGTIDADEYGRALQTLDADLATIARRIDSELDPGTRRVVDLVSADLTDIHRRLRER